MTAVLSFISNIHALWLCMDNLWLFSSVQYENDTLSVFPKLCNDQRSVACAFTLATSWENLRNGHCQEKISITRCTCIINYNNLLLIWRFISLGQYFKILSAWIQSLWKLWLVLDWLFCILKTVIHAQFCPQKAKANWG